MIAPKDAKQKTKVGVVDFTKKIKVLSNRLLIIVMLFPVEIVSLCIQPKKLVEIEMSCGMRFPTLWYVRPAKAPTSLHIRAV